MSTNQRKDTLIAPNLVEEQWFRFDAMADIGNVVGHLCARSDQKSDQYADQRQRQQYQETVHPIPLRVHKVSPLAQHVLIQSQPN
jgi:hypothetical protein